MPPARAEPTSDFVGRSGPESVAAKKFDPSKVLIAFPAAGWVCLLPHLLNIQEAFHSTQTSCRVLVFSGGHHAAQLPRNHRLP